MFRAEQPSNTGCFCGDRRPLHCYDQPDFFFFVFFFDKSLYLWTNCIVPLTSLFGSQFHSIHCVTLGKLGKPSTRHVKDVTRYRLAFFQLVTVQTISESTNSALSYDVIRKSVETTFKRRCWSLLLSPVNNVTFYKS